MYWIISGFMGKQKRTTRHGEIRMRQRMGVQGSVASSTAKNAWKRGIDVRDLESPSELRTWAYPYTVCPQRHGRLYAQMLFIYAISNVKLITVLEIPEQLLDKYKELKEEKDVSKTSNDPGV